MKLWAMWQTTSCGLLWTCTDLVKSHSIFYRIREKKVAEWWVIPYSSAPDVVSTLSHPWRTADGRCLPDPHASWRPLSSQGHITRKPLQTSPHLCSASRSVFWAGSSHSCMHWYHCRRMLLVFIFPIGNDMADWAWKQCRSNKIHSQIVSVI